MRFGQLTAIALAVPLLAACGGTSSKAQQTDDSPGSSASTPASAPATASTAASPTVPAGPVIDGKTFTMTLPAGGHIAKKQITDWSYTWDMGDDWSLSGTAIESPCDGGCQENTPATRAKEAKRLMHNRRDEHDTRLPDVVVGGVPMAHVAGHDGKQANEEFGTWYHGTWYRFEFNIDVTNATRQHVDTLIQQILASVTFKS